jgi:hypothetical protein
MGSYRLMTYTLISTVTVGAGGQATIDFNSIPQTYTDLMLVYSLRDNRADYTSIVALTINGLTTNRSFRNLSAGAGTPNTGTGSTFWIGSINGASATANSFANGQSYISNYTSATYKSINTESVTETTGTQCENSLWANNWASTAAITSLSLSCPLGTLFSQYSTASLYGISGGALAPAVKATGGTIIQTPTYVYHLFTASGTFTPSVALTADILTVAGGGGIYLNGVDGGGGGGGVLGYTAQSLTTTGYTVTVGQGGAQAPNQSSPGGNGSPSSFGALTAASGGGGGGGQSSNGANGASGGGGGGALGGSGGTGISGQGYAGGGGYNNPGQQAGGGGGGAGAVGANGVANVGGNGGNGTSAYSAWGLATGVGQNVGGTVYFAGGGGANSVASRGSDGNGNGSANSGGGKGYQTGVNTGSAIGWSGVVIVRYQ